MIIFSNKSIEKLVRLSDQLDLLGHIKLAEDIDNILYQDIDPIGVQDFDEEQRNHYDNMIWNGIPKGQAYQLTLQKYPIRVI